MQKSSVQARIEALISQLEKEVTKLSLADRAELGRTDADAVDLPTLKDRFEKCISLVDGTYSSRIAELEMEIDYLKELTSAQRLMMEDNLSYIKNLEEKLSTLRTTD